MSPEAPFAGEESPRRPNSGEQSSEESTTRSHSGSALPEDRIGPYRLLELIGQGGMGAVYLAQQERPVRRRVALKLVKLGMDTREVVARFDAERQALALMEHPNIAKVYDAGSTDQGRPYFVMEYVPGERLTDYCDRHRLPVQERLDLMVQVCGAVQHAHQKAIIHRDLKPSNVLVTVQDQRAVPKVIDFGIAKASGYRLTEQTLYTAMGELIGTPEYMSPEQAEMTGLNVDTRTDIYSLGVMLYELLVGAVPFDSSILRSGGLEGFQRTIREKEPERPSTKVSRPGEKAHAAAENRRTTPAGLGKQLKHELDWITMRALEKDRTRRYQTASELASEIERYLKHEPVLAGPPSQVYRLRKYARRHRVAMGAAAAVMLAVLAFGSVSLLQAQKARRESFRARANGVLAAAAAARDPLVKALLVQELEGVPGLTAGQFAKAHAVLSAPLPLAIVGIPEAYPTDISAITAALSPDGTRVAIAAGDGRVRIWRGDGAGQAVEFSGHDPLPLFIVTLAVTDVSFSPDGSHLATCGWDQTVRVWPSEGGDAVILRGHRGRVFRAVFSPNGRRLVSTSEDGTARIWAADGSGAPMVLSEHTAEVRRAAWSPDGLRVVTGSLDGTARVWDTDGKHASIVLEGHSGPLNSVAFSHNGDQIVTASDDGTARVWRADMRGLPIVLRGHTGRVISAAFSSDGERIVTASWDGTARIWRADGTGRPIVLTGHRSEAWQRGFPVRVWRAQGTSDPQVLGGHADGLWSAEFSSDGNRILTASEDGTVRVWESLAPTSTSALFATAVHGEAYRGRTIRFRASVRFEGDQREGNAYLWLRVDRKSGLGFWDNMGNRPIHSSAWQPYEIVGPVDDDAQTISMGLLLTGSGRAWMDAASLDVIGSAAPIGVGLVDGGLESGRLEPWGVGENLGYEKSIVADHPAEGRLCARLERTDEPLYKSTIVAQHGRGVRVAKFFADGTMVFSAAGDGTARLWRASGSGEPMVLKGHERSLATAAFSPDGDRIVTASGDGTARVWRTDGLGQPRIVHGHEGFLTSAAFSHDGTRLVTTSGDSTARVWQADSLSPPVVLRGHQHEVSCAEFSPDDEHIVTAAWDNTARVWRADGQGEPVTLRGHQGGVTCAAFSPDGTRIVTASMDGTVRIWRADGSGPPLILKADEGQVSSAYFSPDGERVLACAGYRAVRVWSSNGTGEPMVLEEPLAARAAFSPDGRRIIVAATNGMARIEQLDGTAEPIVLGIHEGTVNSAEFSSSGDRVVTASEDGTARVWRVTWPGLFDYLRANLPVCLEPEDRRRFLGETQAEAQRNHAQCQRDHEQRRAGETHHGMSGR